MNTAESIEKTLTHLATDTDQTVDQAPNAVSVLHVSHSDVDGGAARAVYRLHRGLQSIQVPSRMLVLRKGGDDSSVETLGSRGGRFIANIMPSLERLPLRFYPGYAPGHSAPWSSGWFPYPIASKINRLNSDLVHLHWIGGGFLPISSLPRMQKPMVWTLHDEWAYTGGCHYTGGCQKFTQSCGACPQLASHTRSDLSHWTWRLKKREWSQARLTFVAPTHWIAEQARRSSLLQDCSVHVIPNGIDTELYRPVDRRLARELLQLPLDKTLILFGALSSTSDRRKGFQYLQPALQRLAADGWSEKAELLVFGGSPPFNKPEMGLRDHYMGYLYDNVSLALLYSAADVFVAPSREDNLPNTVLEALACGTPSIAFDIGGMSDLIEHGKNGYLAHPFDADDVANGLAWILSDDDRHRQLSLYARQKVELEFAIVAIARRYLALYSEICST